MAKGQSGIDDRCLTIGANWQRATASHATAIDNLALVLDP